MNVNRLVPDSKMRTWVGPFNEKKIYLSTGKSESDRLIDILKIDQNHHILDVGCGCGRMTIHFLNYLSKNGKYIGIDNNKTLLEYCTNNIKSFFENSEFYHIDILNAAYNPEGKKSIKDTNFPLDCSSVNIILGISLFTHIKFEDISVYLQEMYRVLKPKGKIATTYFLLNEISEKAMKQKKSSFDFCYPVGDFSKSFNQLIPEEGISHSEIAIIELFKDLNFKNIQVEYGGWVNNTKDNFQDLIVADK